MQVIPSENVVFIDVDETLILADRPDVPGLSALKIEDPLEIGRYIKRYPHEPMIRLLREEKHRGSHIVVWSRGGYEWAVAVIKALQLEKEVDTVMTKPLVYFDDLAVEDWLKNRVYLKPGTTYK